MNLREADAATNRISLIEETFPLLSEEFQAAICILSLVRFFWGAQEKKSPHLQWNMLGILDKMPPRVCLQLQGTRDMVNPAGSSPSSTLPKVMMAFKGQDYENPVNDGFFYFILTSALEKDFFFKSLIRCPPKRQAEHHSSLYSCKKGASGWKRKCAALSMPKFPYRELALGCAFFLSRGHSDKLSAVWWGDQVVQDPAETCEDRVVWGWSVYLLIYEERGTVSCGVYMKFRVPCCHVSWFSTWCRKAGTSKVST